jgi:small subunit ribosomal protein S17
MPNKKLLGEIVSDKMQKTVVVKVTVVKRHPKYHKRYTIHKRYKAHDDKSEFHTGDIVEIEETKPLSSGKRWRVLRKVK